MNRKWSVIIPSIVFLASVFDLIVTLKAERIYEHFYEANPVVRYVWQECGDDGIIIFKMTLTLLSCFASWYVLFYKNNIWQIFVAIFDLSISFTLILWWIIWFFLNTPL